MSSDDDKADDDATPDLDWEAVARRMAESPEPTGIDDGRGDIEKRMHRAGVPRKHAVVVTDGPLQTLMALRVVQEFLPVADERCRLILGGGVGCGKSVAAAWLLGQIGGYWADAPDLGNAYRDQDTWRRMRSCRLLVLDDLGQEYLDDKGWFSSLLDQLLVHRFDRMMPTLITTNVGPDVFVTRYGQRIASRLMRGYCGITDGDLR